MAGAVDLLLYGVAIFISPLAVYFKKGVGAQFWVNCCLYCLMGVPGAIHAFYIIHTNKRDKKSRQGSSHPPSIVVTQQRYSNLPSLPHPDRYRPPASYSPYEDHPPPLPPKQEEEERLPYDPSLHPNATGASVARAKAVLHTYQIPDSTLHPPPPSHRSRRSNPSPEPPRPEARVTPRPELQSTPRPKLQSTPQPELQSTLRAVPQQKPQPQPEPQPEPEPEPEPEPHPIASSSAPTAVSHSDDPTLAYPTGYHPNAEGRNIANAKAVLHTYQIPETTFPLPEPEPESQKENVVDPATRPKPTMGAGAGTGTTSTVKGSMWSLRSKGKGISSLDINSPSEVPTPTGALSSRGRWGAVSSGPSWLKRRKNRQGIPAVMTTTTEDEDGPSTMTMTWDDRYEPGTTPGGGKQKHARTASEPVALPFPMPPGSTRPVVDRTGTSNTILRQPLGRTDTDRGVVTDGEVRLGAVDEDLTPRNERTLSEGEGAAEPKKARRESGRFDTDTEASPVKAVGGEASRTGGLRSRLSRRRPRLDNVGKVNDAQAPNGVASAPPGNVEPASLIAEEATPSAGATSEPVLEASSAAPESSSPTSPTWHRHIAPPAFLASSIEEPRHGIFRRRRTSSTSPPSKPRPTPTSQPQPRSTFTPQQPRSPPLQQLRASPPQQPRPTGLTHNDIDFAMGEFGLGGGGDAYNAGSRALQSRTRRSSSGARRQSSGGPNPGLASPPRQRVGSDGRRISIGTVGSPTPTSEMFSVPVMRRGLTQGTFGTGVTKMSSSTGATSEESAGAQRPRLSPRESSKSQGPMSENRAEYEEDALSQEEQLDRWVKNEEDRRQSEMALDGRSYAPDGQSQSHAHSSLGHVEGPDEASIFSEESSGFAGIGVGSAMEKGRAGELEVWDQPGWDGSNPNSAGPVQTSKQLPQEANPFSDAAAASPSEDTHTSAYATGRESSVSPIRRSPPARPTRAPPAVPKPAPPIRMATFGTGSTTSFGLLSPPRESQRDKGKGAVFTGSPPQHPASLMPARPPPVPSRPSGSINRPQSPKLPPKPAVLRSMSTEDDDMSAVYVRALRDEI